MRFLATLMLTVLLAGPSWAAKDANQAEYDRLSDEMDNLAKRQVWAGAERRYRDLERLGVELNARDFLTGATAARELGNMLSCYQRLKQAARVDGTKEVVNWLWDIDNNYGQVELVSVPPRGTLLEIDAMPFDPNQRNTVEAAVRSAKTDGIFVGMLPKGKYRFAGQPFEVEPGISVRIEVSPKARRQGIIDPVIIYRDVPDAITPGTVQDETKQSKSTE